MYLNPRFFKFAARILWLIYSRTMQAGTVHNALFCNPAFQPSPVGVRESFPFSFIYVTKQNCSQGGSVWCPLQNETEVSSLCQISCEWLLHGYSSMLSIQPTSAFSLATSILWMCLLFVAVTVLGFVGLWM